MKYSRQKFFSNAAFALTAFLSFSLLACDESNPTSFDSPVAYSEAAPGTSNAQESSSSVTEMSSPAPESSSALESSSSVEDSSKLPTTPCTAENEGQVEIKYYQVGSTRLDIRFYHEYFRCEQGAWIQREEWLRCDVDSVQVGDLCEVTSCDGLPNCSGSYSNLYTYAGGGIWEEFEPCEGGNSDKQGSIETYVVKTDTGKTIKHYYCSVGKWSEMDEFSYNCATSSIVHSGDTCVFENDGEYQAYLLTWDVLITFPRKWSRMDYDPVLGYCSRFDYQKYAVRDGKLYYCGFNKWTETDLFPRQYTDPRKEGLSDDEYDVLDLPKEASVGVLAEGLLEVCFYRDEKVCVPQNYYRYGEDGTWKLYVSYRLTEEDFGWKLYAYGLNDESGEWPFFDSYQCNAKGECWEILDREVTQYGDPIPCTSENEGEEFFVLPKIYIYPEQNSACIGGCKSEKSRFKRGYVYQCVDGEKVFKEYAFERIGDKLTYGDDNEKL